MAKEGMEGVGKKEAGMEWLYSSPSSLVDREQYLLGKKIDRQVDPLLASEDREKQVLAHYIALRARLRLCYWFRH